MVPPRPRSAADRLAVRFEEFVAEIGRAAWFAACAEPLTPAEIATAGAYLAALGKEGCAISGVADWRAAAAVTQRPDWNRSWWAAESAAEAALKEKALAEFGEEAVLAGLSRVADVSASLAGAAAVSLARGGVADPALTRVAAGSAAQACHQAALALAAGAPSGHAFALKHQLFAAGRWPLGIVGETFFLL